IWWAVKRPRLVALMPNSPTDTWVPRVANPLLRTLCSLRYFLRAGCNIIYLLLGLRLGDDDHDHGDGLRGDHHVGGDDVVRRGLGLRREFRHRARARPCIPKP